MATKPLPRITPDTRTFWDGCAAGELRVQHCASCARVQFPPAARCAGCGGPELQWRTIAPHGEAPHGEVHSFTVVHRAPSDAFKAQVPYIIALVDLAPGARLMVNVVDCEAQAMAIGMAVTLGFEERRDGDEVAWLPVARPATDDCAGD